MTAAEIAALYSPLWERVPATRPHADGMWLVKGKDYLGLEVLGFSDAHQVGPLVRDTCFGFAATDNRIALALCRSAVLEWLWSLGFTVDTGPFKGGGWFVEADKMHHEVRESLDAALVAAALRVAEGRVEA